MRSKFTSRTYSVILSLLAFLVGCATSTHIITGVVRPSISPDQVRVITSLPKKFEEIGIVSTDSAGWTSQGEVDRAIQSLKEEAAELGANAILLVGHDTSASGIVGNVNPKTGSFWALPTTSTKMEARAIYVIEE